MMTTGVLPWQLALKNLVTKLLRFWDIAKLLNGWFPIQHQPLRSSGGAVFIEAGGGERSVAAILTIRWFQPLRSRKRHFSCSPLIGDIPRRHIGVRDALFCACVQEKSAGGAQMWFFPRGAGRSATNTDLLQTTTAPEVLGCRVQRSSLGGGGVAGPRHNPLIASHSSNRPTARNLLMDERDDSWPSVTRLQTQSWRDFRRLSGIRRQPHRTTSLPTSLSSVRLVPVDDIGLVSEARGAPCRWAHTSCCESAPFVRVTSGVQIPSSEAGGPPKSAVRNGPTWFPPPFPSPASCGPRGRACERSPPS